ncbi:hypothetical protein GCM10028801_30950 [Nocardioides maradonensis]
MAAKKDETPDVVPEVPVDETLEAGPEGEPTPEEFDEAFEDGEPVELEVSPLHFPDRRDLNPAEPY